MRNIVAIMILLLFASCATRSIIPTAIAKGETVNIKVENHGMPSTEQYDFYTVDISKNGDGHQLTATFNGIQNVFKLPANKLELLSEMEVWLKDISNNTQTSYYLVTITSVKQKAIHKINTDIIHDFITGLKKK